MMNKNNQFFIKELVIKTVREFFYNQSFHEVITPVLNKAIPLEPNLYSFSMTWKYMDKSETMYLPTSPEAALKKMLARGLEKVFSIGQTFRNLEAADVEHNPEFLMLEWYRADANYEKIMADVEEVVKVVWKQVSDYLDLKGDLEYQGETINLNSPWKRLSLENLFNQVTDAELEKSQELNEMKTIAKELGYQTNEANWEQLFDQVVMDKIEPLLGKQPLFLLDFPAQTSPLCKVQKNKPYLAERFEVYLGGLEIGNGNNEQTDSDLVKNYFINEEENRLRNNLPSHPIDFEFLEALKIMDNSGKNYAGIGMGIERLVMIMSNQSQIYSV